MTPPLRLIPKALEAAIRARCTEGDATLDCAYPDCGCRNQGNAVAAAVTAYITVALEETDDQDAHVEVKK